VKRNGGDYDFIDVLIRRSTDGGKTFAPAVKLVDHTTYGNGPVNNIRSESVLHRRLVAISPDGVSGWQVRGFDNALQDPVCMASILRHDWAAGDQAGRLLFANPDPINQTPNPCFDRKHLTVKMSLDDGTTWPLTKVLEEGPAGYSDLACLSDGTALCFYECDAVTHMCDTRFLRLARFDKQFLQKG